MKKRRKLNDSPDNSITFSNKKLNLVDTEDGKIIENTILNQFLRINIRRYRRSASKGAAFGEKITRANSKIPTETVSAKPHTDWIDYMSSVTRN